MVIRQFLLCEVLDFRAEKKTPAVSAYFLKKAITAVWLCMPLNRAKVPC